MISTLTVLSFIEQSLRYLTVENGKDLLTGRHITLIQSFITGSAVKSITPVLVIQMELIP